MKSPALLIRVWIRPNRLTASSTIIWAVSTSATSPLTVRKSEASEGLIERDVPTTPYPARRKLSATPAPMPWDAPVTIATLREARDSPARGVTDGSAESDVGLIRRDRPHRSHPQVG